MPSKKKKYNARFPAGRIKKIMQTDEEVGKVAQAVPVIISRTLELFVESLLTKTLRITNARNAKTLSPSHMKQCIISESRFDFLRDLVKNIPDIGVNEEQLSGSEAGYGNEAAASPASTSTSSSSNGGGGVGHGGTATLLGEASSSGPSMHVLQRSESYTPVGSNYAGALPTPAQHHPPAPAQHPQQQPQQSQTNNLKRTLNHINSLNFYKEISLEESSSSSSANFSREPPPKLTRLHSAPAATVTTSNAVPFKIDILPNLPKASTSSLNNSQQQQQPLKVSGSAAPNSNNYKITYKIDPVAAGAMPSAARAPPIPTKIDPPVIKLDYSNLKLPMTVAAEPTKPQLKQQLPHVRQQQLQPTIKIDLSNITNFSSRQSPQSPALIGSSISVKQVPSTPTASTPSTPLSALSSASSTASSASSSKSPYIFQHSAAASMPFASSSSVSSAAAASSSSTAPSSGGSAAPLYSSVSSTIPGMDEDYDDI